ncbi:MAG: hypothetical protein ACI8RD_002296 [Bacillariaceae sp.]|jgi:hypothetical protein
MPSGKKKADAHKVSKKAEMKKKKGQIEDRTFGLKNKKNSKKVQNYVQSVTHSVNNSGDRKERMEAEKRKRDLAQKKDVQKAKKEEQDALFNDGMCVVCVVCAVCRLSFVVGHTKGNNVISLFKDLLLCERLTLTKLHSLLFNCFYNNFS